VTSRCPPIHPGEILRLDFLEPLNLSQMQLARALHVPATCVNNIVRGKRGVTGEMALRLGRYFGTGPEFWMNVQARYNLDVAEDANAARQA